MAAKLAVQRGARSPEDTPDLQHTKAATKRKRIHYRGEQINKPSSCESNRPACHFLIKSRSAKREISPRAMTHLFLPLVHLLILRASVASAEYYAPGQASWLGYSGEDSGTPLNYEDYLPYTYVVFALDSVPLIRSIVAIDSECPQPETAVAGPTPMKTRFLGNPIDSNMMPYKFPVHICEYRAESAHERFALDNGFMTVSSAQSMVMVCVDAPFCNLLIMRAANSGRGSSRW